MVFKKSTFSRFFGFQRARPLSRDAGSQKWQSVTVGLPDTWEFVQCLSMAMRGFHVDTRTWILPILFLHILSTLHTFLCVPRQFHHRSSDLHGRCHAQLNVEVLGAVFPKLGWAYVQHLRVVRKLFPISRYSKARGSLLKYWVR